jgi:hypothetical protein
LYAREVMMAVSLMTASHSGHHPPHPHPQQQQVERLHRHTSERLCTHREKVAPEMISVSVNVHNTTKHNSQWRATNYTLRRIQFCSWESRTRRRICMHLKLGRQRAARRYSVAALELLVVGTVQDKGQADVHRTTRSHDVLFAAREWRCCW